jgi:hypothetical protein
MIMGIHGRLELEPWMERAVGDYDEDAFSLVVKRTLAYGLAAFNGRDAPRLRWVHKDAGGDWTGDDKIRQLAWLEVGVAEGFDRLRLPIQPAVTVLRDVLNRLGRFTFTGLHAILPVHLAVDARADLAVMQEWLALADPDGDEEFIVSVATETEAPDLRESVREYELLTVEPTSAKGTGLAGLIAGQAQLERLTFDQHFACRAPEWSLDAATLATEVFTEALRVAGVERAALTVSADSQIAAEASYDDSPDALIAG